MRWDYMSISGHPFINTTGISRLAGMGTHFSNAFTSCAMCGPSRTSFATGLYPNEHGVRNYGGSYDKSKPNVFHSFGSSGYRRALFGKDHIIPEDAISVYFDEGEDICLGNLSDHPENIHTASTATLEKGSKWDITERLTTAAIKFIEQSRLEETPFIVTINFNDPHPLFSCPEPYASLFSPDQFRMPPNFRQGAGDDEISRLTNWRMHSDMASVSQKDIQRIMAMYSGQIRYVDDQVHRVLDSLEATDQIKNTVVLFWSDHGEFLGDYGVTRKMPAFFDCLLRIPMILFDPTGRVKVGQNHDLIEAMDVMTTILDLCDISPPEESKAQSIVAAAYQPREDIFAEGGLYLRQPQKPVTEFKLREASPPTNWGPGVMLRSHQWKIAVYAEDVGELYNIEEDPYEITNLFNNPGYSDIKVKMMERLVRRLACKGQSPEHLEKGRIKGVEDAYHA